MDDDCDEISVGNNSQPADNSLATDVNGSASESPNKSRYGRLHKPKKSQDFCDIDLAIDTSEDLKSSIRTLPQKSPLKKICQPCVPLISSETQSSPILSVVNPSSPKTTIYSSSPCNITPVKSSSPRKFFKRESTSTQQENQDLESDDVTKVLKIISTKPSDSIQDNTKSTPKSALKTYSNKKKLLNKVALVESFGLPDTPIFPINSSNLTIHEPTLDIAPTTLEEDDIDKQLLNVPWSLDEINTEINYKNEYNSQPSTSSLNRIDFYKVSPIKCDPEPIAKSITPIKNFSTKIIEQAFKKSDVTIKSRKIKKPSISSPKKNASSRITKKGEGKISNGKDKVRYDKAKKSEVRKVPLKIPKKQTIDSQADLISGNASCKSTNKASILSKEEENELTDMISFKGFPKENSNEVTKQTLDFVKSLESSIIRRNILSRNVDINLSTKTNAQKVSPAEILNQETIDKSPNSSLEKKQCEEINTLIANRQNCPTDKLANIKNLTLETQRKSVELKVGEEKLAKPHKKPKIPKTASLTIKSKKPMLFKIENLNNLEKKIGKLKRKETIIKINENDKTEKKIHHKSLQYQAKKKVDRLRKQMKIKSAILRSSPRRQKGVSNSNNVNVEIGNDKNILKTKNDVECDRPKSLRIPSDTISLKGEDTKVMNKLVLEEDENKTKLEYVGSNVPNVSETKEQKDVIKTKYDRKDVLPKRAATKLIVKVPGDDEHSTSLQIDKPKSRRNRKAEHTEKNISTSLLKQRDGKRKTLKLQTNLVDDSMLRNKLGRQNSISSFNSSIETDDEGDKNLINTPKPFKRQKEENVKYKTQKLSFLGSNSKSNKVDNLNFTDTLKSFKHKKETSSKDKTPKLDTSTSFLNSSVESVDEDVSLASDKSKSFKNQKEITKNVNIEINIADSENDNEDFLLVNDRRKSLRNKKPVSEGINIIEVNSTTAPLNSNIEIESFDENLLLRKERRKLLKNKKEETEDIKLPEVSTTTDTLNSSIEIESIKEDFLLVKDRRKSLRNKKNATENIKVQELNTTIDSLNSSVEIESIDDCFPLANNKRKSLRNNKKDITESVKVQEVNSTTNSLNLAMENNDDDFLLPNERRKSLRIKKDLTEDVKCEAEQSSPNYSNFSIGSIEEDLKLINARRKSLRNLSTEAVDENFAVKEKKKSFRTQDEHEHETQKLNSSVNKPDVENIKVNITNKRRRFKIKENKGAVAPELQNNEDLKISKNKKLPKTRKQADKLPELEKTAKLLELEELPVTVESQIETPQNSERKRSKKEKVSPNCKTYNVVEDQDHIKKHFKSQIIDSDDDDEMISQMEGKTIDKEEHSCDIQIKTEPADSTEIPEIRMQEQNVKNFSSLDLTSNEEEETRNNKEDLKLDNKIEIKDLNDDIKVEVSEKDKTENMEYKLGDLIWARIGSYPYWPCMIYADPATNIFKMNIGAIRQRTSYHLRFFGDKGRRSWAASTAILPYTGRNDIKDLMQKWKNNSKVYQKYIIKPYLLPKLQNAIEEAESLKSSTVEERFEFFFNMFADEAEKKARIKVEKNDEVTPVEGQGKKLGTSSGKRVGRPKSRLSLPENERSSSMPLPVKLKKARLNKSQNSSHSESMEQNPIADTSTPQKHLSEKNSNLFDDLGDSLQKNSWQGIDLRRKHIITPLNEVNSECSFSDSDTISKSSSNVSANDLFKVEIVRYKKCSIFKGVSRERVCQVCNKPGDILKCKGPCGGLFHTDCAKISSLEVKQEKLEATEIEIADNVGVSNSTLNILNSEFSNSCGGDVEIIEIDSDSDSSDYSHMLTTQVNVMSSEEFKLLSLPEKIDIKMQELMETVEKKTRYADSTTDEGSSEESVYDPSQDTKKTQGLVIQHVTADSIIFGSPGGTPVEDIQKRKKLKATTKQKRINMNEPACTAANTNEDFLNKDECKDFKCNYCSAGLDPPCHICHMQISSKNDTVLQKCSLHMCGKFYHPQCLKKLWPQTQWSLISTAKHKNSDKQLDTFVCPMHVCHTCISDNPRAASSRCSSSKVVRCLQCPATYHSTNYCVPAGTEILSCSDVICPRHFVNGGDTINTPWCFVCSEGGELICCETCPTSVHSDCLHINLLDDDTFVCEDCEAGRFPLYDEVVWVKLGSYRWWPAVILFPCEVPDVINNIVHVNGQFVVKFFGTHDYFWVSKGRVFLFQEGDRGYTSAIKNRVNSVFNTSIKEASSAHEFKKLFKLSQAAEIKIDNKPPPYVKIKMNRPVGNVRQIDANISNTTPCECNPDQPNPCGPDSYCINRLLWTECDPQVCPAQNKCNNQRFEKRQYPPLVPHRTETRGWGLKTLATINKGDFVIEYVGEVIDDQEYQRRILKMHEQKDENYYFLTIDKDRIIDAGPKGNLARFMNHCCQPNCETQKWTVNGDTRVGLFAFVDIPEGSELTFNYNLECVGTEKKICNCGAPNCSGFIGVKVKQDESQKKSRKSTKKKKILPPQIPKNEGPCFICKKTGEVGTCHNKICNKFYHLECVNLEFWPEGKWVCPWHNCNICSKRTIRCCVKCLNSYCPVHSEGNVRYDKLLGFVCSEHDPTKESHELETPLIIKSNSSSVLTTEETDITSTTSEELCTTSANSSSCDLNSTAENVESTSMDSLPSTPKQSTDDRQSSSEEEKKLEKQIKSPPNRKRKARQSGGARQHKKIKLANQSISPVKSKPKPNSISLVSMSMQNEIKLSSTVPVRHLRTTRNSPHLNVEVERFLKHQSEVEKGLPFRKRSRLRYENNL